MEFLPFGLRKKVFLIVNPKSGMLRSHSALFDITDELCRNGAMVTVQTTQYRGNATELAAYAAGAGYDVVACCGGDGTLNETVTGLLESGTDVPIGYIPAGSTNDFAASVGIPLEPRTAARAIICGEPFQMDIGSWGGKRIFTYIASFGAFTAASYNAPQPTKNAIGHLAYIIEGIKDIQNLRPQHVRVSSQGIERENDYIFAAVSNSTSVGGIVKLDRAGVSFDDGVFEVILVRSPANLVEFSQIVQAVQSSDYDANSMFDFFHTNEVSFDTFAPMTWSLDGERADGERLITIKNMPRVLTVMRGTE